MKFLSYLKDKSDYLLLTGIRLLFFLMIGFAFKMDSSVVLFCVLILVLVDLCNLLIPYLKKHKFYTDLLENISYLDQSYFVLETLDEPRFYEGEILYQALYRINKSMLENVSQKEEQVSSFKDYIEMWIHEVKIPLSSLELLLNNKQQMDLKTKVTFKRLEDTVDQILYYVRSENAEKDYYIKKVDLNKVIKNVCLKNMDDLLAHHIQLSVKNLEAFVYTDSKWIEFILNQIINNSIKYMRKIPDKMIEISVIEDENRTILSVFDNGMGIPKNEIGQVFDMTFTGTNGRVQNKSTGMGLFIVKNLCQKLGHQIQMTSQENEFTKVEIIFAKNHFYDVVQ